MIGRVSGFRGTNGEVTVRVVSGDAKRWVGVSRVLVSGTGVRSRAASRRVESARAYRDRLVLKLAGIEDADGAAALTGREVRAPAAELPRLPRGVYWMDRLVGATVKDARWGDLGRVRDVIETGGTDVLRVEDDRGVETLVPLAGEFVTEIDEASGTIRVAIPEGLKGLNP